MNTRFEGWPHVICSQQFSRYWLEAEFLPMTDHMEQFVLNNGCNLLQGRRMISLFYQPSTRTRMSFELAMDYLGYQYFCSYAMKIIRTRGFNHTGPRRGETFVTSNFAKQIAMIEKGKQEPIMHVGNLEAERDWTDVRDMVKAYLLSVEKCDPGDVYNICVGSAVKIKDMLDMLLKMSKVKVEVQQDPARMRPSEVPVLIGDNTKFVEKTGWKPEIPFEKTMEDLLNYWRNRI